MGSFIYNSTTRVEIEDRALAHLRIVITDKLRRGEAFTFSWKEDVRTGSGRTTVWVNNRSSLAYRFHGSRPPAINKRWIVALTQTAGSSTGLHLVPEPAQGSPGNTHGWETQTSAV